MGGTLHGTVDGNGSPNDVADGARNRLQRAASEYRVVGRLLATVAGLLALGVVLALLEPGNPDNTAILNVIAGLAIILAYTVGAASLLVGAALALKESVGTVRSAV